MDVAKSKNDTKVLESLQKLTGSPAPQPTTRIFIEEIFTEIFKASKPLASSSGSVPIQNQPPTKGLSQSQPVVVNDDSDDEGGNSLIV